MVTGTTRRARLLRAILRLVGLLILLLGVYCIVTGQVFLGVIAIIISLLIFPNREGSSSGYHHFEHEHRDHSYSFENDSGGGDSGGGGGD
ncbi:hypothetical protein ACWM35_23210 [Neobacillus sp. K501]